MKVWMFAALIIASFVAVVGPVNAETYVRGYTRSNGTYVAPHYRSSPNSSVNDNWSVSPNVNPHTGQLGTRQPSGSLYSPQLQQPYANPYSTPYSNPYLNERR